MQRTRKPGHWTLALGRISILVALTFGNRLFADEPATGAKQPDELVFIDGERLLGHLERSDKDSVTFKSDMAGEVKVPWNKIKQLHSYGEFAVVPKEITFGRKHEVASRIPQGKISVSDQKISVANGQATPQTYPVSDTGFVIDEPTFQKSLARPSLFEDWRGSATAGVSLVLATQNSRSYTSGIALSRAIPTEPWMNPENRTAINFTSAFGELTQPGQPLTKTSIFHADAERDEYFSKSVYSFAEAAYDHNYSQGLDLQQTYGGGVGWTIEKTAAAALDAKAELTYVNQEFQSSAQNQKLVGSVFSEGYQIKFRHGIVFQESLSVSPAWNNLNAYSANGNIILTIPVARRVSLTLNSADTFLNDPSAGFRKNSFQFSTGLSYTLP